MFRGLGVRLDSSLWVSLLAVCEEVRRTLHGFREHALHDQSVVRWVGWCLGDEQYLQELLYGSDVLSAEKMSVDRADQMSVLEDVERRGGSRWMRGSHRSA